MAQPSGTKFRPVYLGVGFAVAIVLALVIGYVASTGTFSSERTTTVAPLTEKSQNIVNGMIGVENRNFHYYTFSAPSGSINARVDGRFEVSDGRGIRVIVFDQDGFTNYQNNQDGTSYFITGEQNVGNSEVNVATGERLYLVYDNKNSILTDKNVRTTVNLFYTN